MSKRRLENEMKELSEAVLSECSSDKRLQTLLEAKARGKEVWTDHLIEMCPQYNYYLPDLSFLIRVQLAQQLAHHAVYELHTTYLHYELVRTKQHYTWVLDYERDEEPTDEELDRAADRADELRELFAELYVAYHAYQRFATEVLGVAPETWLALHPDGLDVFEIVTKALDNATETKLAESHLSEKLDEHDETVELSETEQDDNQEVTLKYMSDVRYTGLVTAWEDVTAEIP